MGSGRSILRASGNLLKIVAFAGVTLGAVLTTAVKAQHTSGAAAPSAGGVPTSDRISDGPIYQIHSFAISYNSESNKPRSDLPDVAKDVMRYPIVLSESDGTFVVPPSLERRWRELPANKGSWPVAQGTLTTHRYTLATLAGATPKSYHASAVWAIEDQIRQYFNEGRHLLGVFVQPAETDIGTNMRDVRADKRGALHLVIFVGRVAQLRTVALGERYPQGQTVGPIHEGIRDNSPVQPESSGNIGSTNLLRQDLIDDYIYRLNRHPGRRVDVAVSALSDQPEDAGKVVLDYRVTEVKPWSAYFQTSNTGTRATSEWRERFGYLNNQLFSRDDIFSIDYSTASFAQSHTVVSSYEAPFGSSDRWRWRFDGSYDEFTASDLGISNSSTSSFNGQQSSAGLSAIYNAGQWGNLFLDFVGAARAEYDDTRSSLGRLQGNSGSSGFIVPSLGARLLRSSDERSFFLETIVSGRLSTSNTTELNKLGRLDTDEEVPLLTGNVSYDIFLEPFLAPEAFKAGRSTLAHELILSARGQYAFGDRLVPQAEEVAGGFYSVRGYPESVSSGDSVVIGSAEYRFHIPRALTPYNEERDHSRFEKWLESKNFRFRPRDRYQRPDWDLALAGFVDAGRTVNSRRQPFEKDQTLVGGGAGVLFSYRQNVTIVLDYGIALTPVSQSSATEEVKAGYGRLNFALTLTY